MAFDVAYANGILVGILRNFIQASGMAFDPGGRELAMGSRKEGRVGERRGIRGAAVAEPEAVENDEYDRPFQRAPSSTAIASGRSSLISGASLHSRSRS